MYLQRLKMEKIDFLLTIRKPESFLDIDGVLNPTLYNNALYKVWKNNNAFKSRDHFGDYFAPYTVDALAKIIQETCAQIVISSTWRLSGLMVM